MAEQTNIPLEGLSDHELALFTAKGVNDLNLQMSKVHDTCKVHADQITQIKTKLDTHLEDHDSHSAIPINETAPIPSGSSQIFKSISVLGLPPSLAASVGIFGKFANWW